MLKWIGKIILRNTKRLCMGWIIIKRDFNVSMNCNFIKKMSKKNIHASGEKLMWIRKDILRDTNTWHCLKQVEVLGLKWSWALCCSKISTVSVHRMPKTMWWQEGNLKSIMCYNMLEMWEMWNDEKEFHQAPSAISWDRMLLKVISTCPCIVISSKSE